MSPNDIAWQFARACNPDEPSPPRAWIIECASGVILTHYAAVAEKYALSPCHEVTPYFSKVLK